MSNHELNIKEIMGYDNKEFIINAYKILFEREPDDDGFTHYFRLLQQGTSKEAILKQLQASSEGRKMHIKKIPLKLFFITNRINNLRSKASKAFYSALKKLFKNSTKIKMIEKLLQNTLTELAQVQTTLAKINREIKSHDKKIIKLFEETEIMQSEKIRDWDLFYSKLEDNFRGPSETIKERINVYIPLIQEAVAGNEGSPVLDIGCGRGEWLEVLKEQHVYSLGIDSNPTMIERCLQNNLAVINEDVMSYLKKQTNNYFGSITGFHIIEHLPFVTLMNLLDEIYRTLKKGGMVLLETPNPQNMIVSSCTFHYDPTHRKPLPPNLMKFILQHIGFTNISVKELNPISTSVQGDSDLTNRFNNFFFGPQDYAVIGYK